MGALVRIAGAWAITLSLHYLVAVVACTKDADTYARLGDATTAMSRVHLGRLRALISPTEAAGLLGHLDDVFAINTLTGE